MSRAELIELLADMTGYTPEFFANWSDAQLEEVWDTQVYA
jgi:hypothetical protein